MTFRDYVDSDHPTPTSVTVNGVVRFDLATEPGFWTRKRLDQPEAQVAYCSDASLLAALLYHLANGDSVTYGFMTLRPFARISVPATRLPYAIAGAIVGLMAYPHISHDSKVAMLRSTIGKHRLLADDVWQAARRPWATHSASSAPVTFTDEQADAFWKLASALEDPDAPGILMGDATHD